MGESNGNRQTRQNQSLSETGATRNDKEELKSKQGENSKEIAEILAAYQFMKAEGLSEIDFEVNNTRFHIKRKTEPVITSAIATIKPAPPVKHEKEIEELLDTISIKSPLAGTFYLSSKPGGPPFVTVGDTVEKNTTLCIIEAMKVMNEIKSDSKYKVVKILVTNGKFVSVNEVLFLVKPVE